VAFVDGAFRFGKAGQPSATEIKTLSVGIKLAVKYDFAEVDAFFASGHKFGATKGCGFFYLNPALRIEPILHGGCQEGGYRPGTTDACAAFLLSEALQERAERIEQYAAHVTALGKALAEGLEREGITYSRTIPPEHSSPYILF
jgi:cysteine desulfurase